MSQSDDDMLRVHGLADELNVKLIPQTGNVREMQTILRDPATSRQQFVFYSHRLIRLIVEQGLEQMPVNDRTVTTPTGAMYEGLSFGKGICGVTIMRAGEAMERGLRECYKAIRVGHILIRHEEGSVTPQVYYANFPPDISERIVLLLDPILESGATVLEALSLLKDLGVAPEHVTLLNVFASEDGLRSVRKQYDQIRIITSEITDTCSAINFSDRYFGTE